MLTEGQKNYLNKLSTERSQSIVRILPFNPQTQSAAQGVIDKIKTLIPKVDVRFMGASALGISGQNDVDVYLVTREDRQAEYLSKLQTLFGEQQKKNKWNWYKDGIEISVYLSNPDDQKFKEQLDIFDLFKNNQKILREYERLKKSPDGKTYKEYQTAKYEFYNRVLGISS